MYPGRYASENPEGPALIMARVHDGGLADHADSLTWFELDALANRVSHLFRRLGMTPGDHLAFVLDNEVMTIPVAWGATYAGLIYTPINFRLTVQEAAYIVNDCGATTLIVSARLADQLAGLLARTPGIEHAFALSGQVDGYGSFEDAIAELPSGELDEKRLEGRFMFYSSGTTGRPKGVEYDLPLQPLETPATIGSGMERYEIGRKSVYLCPAPLYHAAACGWSMGVQREGATVVVMDRFAPEACLQLIERYRITHAQFVPTMFVRMLRLPEETRSRYDLSSLRVVIHAAAPCPIDVKRQMIDWWGPILHEYYSATEGGGTTVCSPTEWQAHPGTVGRATAGTIHVCDDDGRELEPGEVGVIFFEGGGRDFRYHNDPVKTASSRHPNGWSTHGDMGYVDAEGWLFLTDRKDFVIISGGVNIYPQEIEDALIMHPDVLDVAVIGIPEPEFGEQVKAFVQLVDPTKASAELEADLRVWCRARLAGYKCPRSIEFRGDLPRHPTGKLYKRLLRDDTLSR